MAKREKPPPMELELKRRLDEQDKGMEVLNKTMQQVLELLKGSSMMNTPGVIKTFQDFIVRMDDFEKKMDYFERWWDLQKLKKRTYSMRTANLLTRGSSMVGIIATIAAVIYTIIQIAEHLKK